MASSLSFMRMQLSDDPEDWAWGRWYWTQEGAEPLNLWTAYGHPLWEDEDNRQRPGPQFILDSSMYAPSRTSPFPGLVPHGKPEWYEDGLPLDQRTELDAGPWCGGELWQSEGNVGIQGSSFMGTVPFVVGSTGSNKVGAPGFLPYVKPAGVQAGDLLIAYAMNPGGVMVGTPTGFTVLASGTTAGGIAWKISYKVAGGSEPAAYPVLVGAFVPPAGILVAVRDQTGLPTASTTDGNGTAPEAPSVTAAAGNLLLAFMGHKIFTAPAWTAPAGMALQQSVTQPFYDNAKLYREPVIEDGATGVRTAGLAASADWVASSVLIA